MGFGTGDDLAGGELPAPRQIVACLGLSPRMRAVAGQAAQLAAQTGAPLVFVHAAEDEAGARPPLEDVLDELNMEARPELVVRDGRADKVVCDVAGETGADLILAGALEKDPTVQQLVGSVARRIARNAPCSVLLLTAPRTPPAPFARIVASVQYDEASHELMRTALRVARTGGAAELHVVHEANLYGAARVRTNAGSEEEERDRAMLSAMTERSRLGDFLGNHDLANLDVRASFLEGQEGVQSADYAETVEADLLFLPAPSRKLTVLDRFFQHPVERALEKLPCALWLFRAEREDEE